MESERRYAAFRVAGRTLSGTALRYGDVAPEFRERFVPGAFGEDLPAIALNLQHDARMVIAEPGAFVLADGPRELSVRADLAEGSAALALVRRGALNGFSIEFHSLAERIESGIRVVERAELTGIALVDKGAYPQSKVQVRASAAHAPRCAILPRIWL